LTWATSIVFGVFILLAVLLDLVVSNQYKSTAMVATTPPPAQSMPVMPPPFPVDNTAPVETPTTNPVEVVKQVIQNATTQPIINLKSPTQP